MTRKLFYQDSYIKEFTANVLACHPLAEGFEIVLDQTAFFPEGGGQYSDTGSLVSNGKECEVFAVQEREGVIYHITNLPLLSGTQLIGKLNWDERFMKMQQHTGEHIVSGLVNQMFGYKNVGFHLGSEDSTMDFAKEMTKEQLRELEQRANEVIVANLEVTASYPGSEEAKIMDYRSKIEIATDLRIITIPKCDVCACCAPHVGRTGEVGVLKFTQAIRYKGGMRLHMLCGFRALEDYRQKEASVKTISNLLSVPEENVALGVENLREEVTSGKHALREAQMEILKCKVSDIPATQKMVCFCEEALEGDLPRHLVNLVLAQAGREFCAVLYGVEDTGCRYVCGSKTMDLRSLAKELNQSFSGRGGGKAKMIQGFVQGKMDVIEAWLLEQVEGHGDE